MARLLLSALALLAWPTAGQAQTPLAILDLHFHQVPAPLEARVRSTIAASLQASGYQVLSQPATRSGLERSGAPVSCTVGPCLSQVGRALKVQRVLVGGISAQGTSYDITLTLLECGGGSVLAQVNQRCDVCNFNELEAQSAKAAAALHKKALVHLASQAVLQIETEPPGASLLLDGSPVGRAPLTRVLPPGTHKVEAVSKGRATTTRRVELSAGSTTPLRIKLLVKGDLTPIPTPRAANAPSSPRWVKWALLGAGVLAGGLGGGLVALDGRERSDPRYLYDTRTAGVTLISLGAAAAVAASLMALAEAPRRDRPPRWASIDHVH